MSKAVLITGCFSGIGLIAAQDLRNRGYRMLAACRKPQDVENMHQLGLEGIELDLDDSVSVERAAAQVITLTGGGKLYALLNNGGFGMYGALSSISRRQMEHSSSPPTCSVPTPQFDPVAAASNAATRRRTHYPDQFRDGLVSGVGRGAYAASKFALEAWSDALRMELHSSGIQVSLNEPAPIFTHFTQNTDQAQSDQPKCTTPASSNA